MSTSQLHALLLLSDSALPLGSFAFSSGLESYLAHQKTRRKTTQQQDIIDFVHDSVLNLSSTALPYVTRAHRQPPSLRRLDDDFDASTSCTVARRASTAQGKALLTIWDRVLADGPASSREAANALTDFNAEFKQQKESGLCAHFAPLFGCVCAALSIPGNETCFVFLLNHAKAVLSAAVRAGVLGPYQSHAILASAHLAAYVAACVERDREREVEDAAVSVPTMDLWMGRHELLYSRIFNS